MEPSSGRRPSKSSNSDHPESPASYRGNTDNEFSTNLGPQDSDKTWTLLLASLPNIGQAELGTTPLHRSNSDSSLRKAYKTRSRSVFSPSSWYKSRGGNRLKSHTRQGYTIEYSVFRPLRYLPTITNSVDLQNHFLEIRRLEGFEGHDALTPENYVSIAEFEALLSTIIHDVENVPELKPQRISQGSSGSYFIMGNDGVKTRKRGIFKPKDEEPYGPLSPKWTKWLHRTFFPCFFGRSCLIPNLGYISEAAACVLDRQLMSYIVPHTDVIHLRSPQFYHSPWERFSYKKNTRYKIGSFQVFLNNYIEAHDFLRMHPIPQSLDRMPHSRVQYITEDHPEPVFAWSTETLQQFQEELEKLVILDYIMRNTDRGLDNWMIRLDWVKREEPGEDRLVYPELRIGAIDSGLAFPWKHPDEWRSFPFGWLFLPYSLIGQPFSLKTRQHYLPLLTSKIWWEQTVTKLRVVFEKDADFKERMWRKQLAVLKGQAINVVEVLKNSLAGPLELTRRENLLVWDDLMSAPVSVDNTTLHNAIETSIFETPRLMYGKTEDLETTPLLRDPDNDTRQLRSFVDLVTGHFPHQMSGFEVNETFDEDARSRTEKSATKSVIIERLERASGRPPVFTWC